MKKWKGKKNRGITLIALVVMVIILLILAGITISPFIGDNGIIEQTSGAAKDTKKTQYKEDLDVMGSGLKVEKELKGKSTSKLMDRYQEEIPKDGLFKDSQVNRRRDDCVRVITPEGYVYDVTEEEVIYQGTLGEDPPPEIEDGQIWMTQKPKEEEWTNKEVEVTIANNIEDLGRNFIEYTIDGGKEWHEYLKPFMVKNNFTVINVRLANILDEYSSIDGVKIGQINNIDREPPINLKVSNHDPRTNSITVYAEAEDHEATSIDGKSDLDVYYFSKNGGNTWEPEGGLKEGVYTFEKLQQEQKFDIKVKIVDNAKNDTLSQNLPLTTRAVTDLKKKGDGGGGTGGEDGNVTFSHQPDSWNKGPITVYVDVDKNAQPDPVEDPDVKLQFRTKKESGGGWSEWQEYDPEKGIVVEDQNTEVDLRYFDGTNEGDHVSDKVDHIDKEPPVVEPTTRDITSHSVHVDSNANDPAANVEKGSGQSGIDKYWYKIVEDGQDANNVKWEPENGTKDAGHDFDNLKDNKGYDIYVKVKDVAGNETTKGPIHITTQKVPDLTGGDKDATPQGNTTISYDPSDWCQGPVKVTITTQGVDTTTYKLQYKFKETKTGTETDWQNYNENAKPQVSNNFTTVLVRMWDGVNESKTYASGQVTIIDRLPPIVPIISEKHTTRSITVTATNIDDQAQTNTDGKSGVVRYAFSNNGGQSWMPNNDGQTESSYTFDKLEDGKGYSIQIKVIDRAKNEQKSAVQTVTTVKVPDLNNSNTKFSHQPDGWTHGPVTVKVTPPAETPPDGTELQYSTDGGNSWHKYDPSTGVSIPDNDTNIEFRYWDGVNDGTHVKDIVDKIDKQKPTVVPTETHKSNSAHIEAHATDPAKSQGTGQSGIDKYWFAVRKKGATGNIDWKPDANGKATDGYDFTGLEDDTDYEYYVKVTDKAGNETIDGPRYFRTVKVPDGGDGTSATSNIKISYTPTTWTKNDVTVTVSTSITGYTLQYSTNGSNWTNASGLSATFNQGTNCTVYARLWDGNNTGTNATGTITIIDKLVPNQPTFTATKTTKSITVSVTASDQVASAIYGSSGINTYYYSINGGAWQTGTGASYTFNNLNHATNYSIKVKVADKAGNEKECATAQTIQTNTVPAANGTLNISFANGKTSWAKSTTATVTGSLAGYTVQYRLNDTGSWTNYTSAIPIPNNNTKVSVCFYDGYGNNRGAEKNDTSAKIDNLKPNTPTITINDSDITSKSIKATFGNISDQGKTNTSDVSGIARYYCRINSGGSWIDMGTSGASRTFDNLTYNTDYTIEVRVVDNAGNEVTTSKTVKTKSFPTLASSNIVLSYDPNDWCQGPVMVTIAINGVSISGFTIEYSINGGQNWSTYSDANKCKVTENFTTVWVRLASGNDHGDQYSSGQVTKIDRLKPSVTLNSATGSGSSVTVTATATDQPQTDNDGCSQVEKYWFSKDGGSSWEPTNGQTSNSYQFKNLWTGNTYTFKVKVQDKAKNEATSTENKSLTYCSGTTTGYGWHCTACGDKTSECWHCPVHGKGQARFCVQKMVHIVHG